MTLSIFYILSVYAESHYIKIFLKEKREKNMHNAKQNNVNKNFNKKIRQI